MNEEVNLDIVESFIAECNIEGDSEISLKTNGLTKNAIEALLKMYYEEKEKNEKIKSKLKEMNIPMETLLAEFERLEDLEDELEIKKLIKKERRKEYAKKYYEKHKEERKAYQKKYAKEHYDKVLEANKKYKQKHPEKFAESKKKWYDNNKEKILKQQKEYRFKMKLKNYEE